MLFSNQAYFEEIGPLVHKVLTFVRLGFKWEHCGALARVILSQVVLDVADPSQVLGYTINPLQLKHNYRNILPGGCSKQELSEADLRKKNIGRPCASITYLQEVN